MTQNNPTPSIEERAKDYADVQCGDPAKFTTINERIRHDECIEDFKSGFIAGSSQGSEGWISVKDELPEIETHVEVWEPSMYWMNNIAQGFIDKENKQWRIKFDNNEEAGHFYSPYVTHWRPLPKPPTS